MRWFALTGAGFLIALSVAQVSAKSPAAVAPPVISISPIAGDLNAVHQLHIERYTPNASPLTLLLDPDGNQTVLRPQTDGRGVLNVSLAPTATTWRPGLYRVVVALSGGRSMSATFTAGDAGPHLYALPYLPSPTAALNFVGTGLPANTAVTVHLWLTGGNLGERDVQATTDAGGAFSIYVWPQQMGTPFYPAGQYRVSIATLGLQTTFWVREHPSSGTIAVDTAVQPRTDARVTFSHYTRDRYLWGVYTGPDGKLGGEFLVGPTDGAGNVSVALRFSDLGAGRYYIATPYDSGETTFDLVEPTPTATATSTPTPTATPTGTKTPLTKKCKKVHGRQTKGKHCKR